jgi:DNA-binding transcriptional MerR regulator
MNNRFLTRDEVLQKIPVSEETLGAWIKDKLVKPAGFADDHTPLFSAETLGRLEHILKLKDLGYGTEEIQKIVKKFGLPKSGEKRAEVDGPGKFLTVGNLAEKAGVSPRTIKHWEDKGIIEPDMRSEGGFRLYPEIYVYFCKLIQDLQLFGYALEEIKVISDYFRDFLALRDRPDDFAPTAAEAKFEPMLEAIQTLRDKMKLLKEGIERWDDLIKKKKKEILGLKAKIQKKGEKAGKA